MFNLLTATGPASDLSRGVRGRERCPTGLRSLAGLVYANSMPFPVRTHKARINNGVRLESFRIPMTMWVIMHRGSVQLESHYVSIPAPKPRRIRRAKQSVMPAESPGRVPQRVQRGATTSCLPTSLPRNWLGNTLCPKRTMTGLLANTQTTENPARGGGEISVAVLGVQGQMRSSKSLMMPSGCVGRGVGRMLAPRSRCLSLCDCSLRTICVASAALVLASSVSSSTAPVIDAPLVLTQVPCDAREDSNVWDASNLVRADWFAGARVVLVLPDGQSRGLSRGFNTACDPDLAFFSTHHMF